MARHERYPSNAAMRRTIHVMNVLRVIPRRRASLSMYSATSSSKVRPARDALAGKPDQRYGHQLVSDWCGDGPEGAGICQLGAVFSRLDNIVPQYSLGVQQGFVHTIAHGCHAWDVGKYHSIGSFVTV